MTSPITSDGERFLFDDMSGGGGFSSDLDKGEFETDFFSPLSQYSASMTMSEADLSPLPVYNDSNNGLASFSAPHNDHNPRMTGHGSSHHMTADDQKRLKQAIRRERNRAAAAKCRQKKLDRIHSLQATVENIKAINHHLLVSSFQLRREIQELRQCLTEHQRQGCNCNFGIGASGNYN